jgi:ribosome-associated protein
VDQCSFEGEYIQLNQLLKKVNWVSSGGEAKGQIEQGRVKVNGQVASEIRKKLRDGDIVEYGNHSVRVHSIG